MNREILRLAIPNILSNLSVPLLGLVDAALMGHLPNAQLYLGAIAIAAAIFNILYWSFGFLRMGTTGLTAQAWGAEKGQESLLVLGRGLFVALGLGFLLIFLQIPVEWAGLALMEGSPEAKEIASSYFFIRIYAAPATLALYVFHGWFLGMQNAIIPLGLSILVNVVNIGANFLFVYGFEMGAEGIAWGTLIAQYSSLALAALLFFLRYRPLLAHRKGARLFDPAALRRFFTVNRDIFIRTACLVFTFSYFTSRSGVFGDGILAANALLLQLLYLMSYIVDGFGFAAESLLGKYKGAEEKGKMPKLIRRIILWGMGFGSLFSLAYWLGGESILTILSNDEKVVEEAVKFLPWLIWMPIGGTFAFMWDGIYIGATATVDMRNTMIAATFVIFLPIALFTTGHLGNDGLWLAITAFMLARGVFLAALAKKNGLHWR